MNIFESFSHLSVFSKETIKFKIETDFYRNSLLFAAFNQT